MKFAPFNGCSDLDELQRPILAKGIIAIIERGDCMFVDKVRMFEVFNLLFLYFKINFRFEEHKNSAQLPLL